MLFRAHDTQLRVQRTAWISYEPLRAVNPNDFAVGVEFDSTPSGTKLASQLTDGLLLDCHHRSRIVFSLNTLQLDSDSSGPVAFELFRHFANKIGPTPSTLPQTNTTSGHPSRNLQDTLPLRSWLSISASNRSLFSKALLLAILLPFLPMLML